jgi:hypothetical protein
MRRRFLGTWCVLRISCLRGPCLDVMLEDVKIEEGLRQGDSIATSLLTSRTAITFT